VPQLTQPYLKIAKVVVTTLVSDIATAYFTVRELDYKLEISTQTLETG